MSEEKDQHPETETRRFTDGVDQCETVIGADAAIKGELRGTSSVELQGSLNGKMELDGFLWIRVGGRLEGDIEATAVVIEGEVEGNIDVREKAELRSTCRVKGDIAAGSLAIAEGGHFEGQITMEGKPSSRSHVTFVEKRSS